MAAKKSEKKKPATAKKKAASKKAAPKKAAPKKKPAPRKKPAAAKKKKADLKAPTEAVHDAPAAAPPAIAKMPPRRADGTITIAYSPDSDDAFMFYALLSGKVETEDRTYELVQDEIQTLNEKALEGVYDVTAISFGAYPLLQSRYALLPCGASFGDGRGPVLVARTPIRTNEVNGLTVAVPGLNTSAALALRLWLPRANLKLVEYPFDEVIDAVKTGRARAGVLIHEKQLTFQEDNFVRVVDFGQWWSEKTEGLPLPLGANAIRRDIPEEERAKIALDIKRSIAYGLGHREETVKYASQFAKGLEPEVVDQYISMYVNELALDYAERGRQAIIQFFAEAKRFGFLEDVVVPEFA